MNITTNIQNSDIIVAIASLWFVFFFAIFDATEGNFLQKFLYKMAPMILSFLLGLVAFKVI